jgi:spore germination cell wall hydrolase CwlJ-like protein
MKTSLDLQIMYDQYLEEKKGLAALGLAAGIALSGAGGNHVHKEPAVAYKPQESQNLKYLALTIWGEARNQGEAGMRAVGHVIKNRAESERWGDNIKDVVLQRKQFSSWNANDPNKDAMQDMLEIDRMFRDHPEGFDEWETKFMKSPQYQEYKAYREAKKVAKGILNGSDPDPTKGALFYHTTGVHPVWAKGQEPIAKFADHIFYTTDKKA